MPTEAFRGRVARDEQGSLLATLRAIDAREARLVVRREQLIDELQEVDAELDAIEQLYDRLRRIQPRL